LYIYSIRLDECAELVVGRTEVLIEREILAATNSVASRINWNRLEGD
jgi:hypothetical protein